jgi:hypothetical protein
MAELPRYAIYLMKSGREVGCKENAEIVRRVVEPFFQKKKKEALDVEKIIKTIVAGIEYTRKKMEKEKDKESSEYRKNFEDCKMFCKNMEKKQYELDKMALPNFYADWENIVEKLRSDFVLEFVDKDINYAQKSLSFIVAVFYVAAKRMLAASLSIHFVRKAFPKKVNEFIDAERLSVSGLFSSDKGVIPNANFYTVLLAMSNNNPLGMDHVTENTHLQTMVPAYAKDVWLERDFFSAARFNSTEIHQFEIDPAKCATYENKHINWNVMCPPSKALSLPFYDKTIMKNIPSSCESRNEYPGDYSDGVFEFKGVLACKEFLDLLFSPNLFSEPSFVAVMLRDLVHTLGYPMASAQVTVTRGLEALRTAISTIVSNVEDKDTIQLGKFILGRVMPQLRGSGKGEDIETLRAAWANRKEVSFTKIDIGQQRKGVAHLKSYTFSIVYIPTFKDIPDNKPPKISNYNQAKKFISEHISPGTFYVIDSHSVARDGDKMAGVVSSFSLSDPNSIELVTAEIERYISGYSSQNMSYIKDLCDEFFAQVIRTVPGLSEISAMEESEAATKYPVAAKIRAALMENHMLHVHDMETMAFVPSSFASSSVACIDFKKESDFKKAMKLVSRKKENIENVSGDKELLNKIAASVIVPSFVSASQYFRSVLKRK